MHHSHKLQWQFELCNDTQDPDRCTVYEVPVPVLVMHCGPLLAPRDLFLFCATHSSVWRKSAAFVGWLAADQHGTDAEAVTNFGQLRTLEETPCNYVLDFRSPKFLVENGVFLTSRLQRGTYCVSIAGLQNPDFGILDLWLYDIRVTNHSEADWQRCEASKQDAFPAFEVDIEETGKHIWRFETNYHQRLSESQGMRLAEFRVECVCAGQPRRTRACAWLRATARQTVIAIQTRMLNLLWMSRWLPKLKQFSCAMLSQRQ
mmetsp:Transcript_55172/g.96581  ORF Transcript_55172/g.96581 Transcript_55172/m.96581 type:complete len:260 (-) Transcript_55172:81-860(-)